MDKDVKGVYTTLKWVFGLLPIVAGLDKFTNLLTNWAQYLNPAVTDILHIAPRTFMELVGVIEIIAGIILFINTRVGAWIVGLWLFAIALNLITVGYYDLAVRDLVMSITAFCLARLAKSYA
jgi:uncharacterized membrane protein YphA (DoxX/SURF4 family)